MLVFGLLFIVSAHSLHTYAAVTKQPVVNTHIQYPESIKGDDDIPESCKHLTYCTIKPKNYPVEKLKEMFKGYKAIPQPSMLVELENRQGDPNQQDNCESEVTFEPLYKVKEKNGNEWRTVVQGPGIDFVQRVRLETCKNPGEKCFNNFSSSDFVTYCKQKVNTWKVLVVKGENEREWIETELPVCCSCHYKEVDLVARFGKH